MKELHECDLCGWSSPSPRLGLHVLNNHPEVVTTPDWLESSDDGWRVCLCGLWFNVKKHDIFGAHLLEKGGVLRHILEHNFLPKERT